MRRYKHKLVENSTKVTGFQHEIIKKKIIIPISYTIDQNIVSTNHTPHQGLQLQSVLMGNIKSKYSCNFDC